MKIEKKSLSWENAHKNIVVKILNKETKCTADG